MSAYSNRDLQTPLGPDVFDWLNKPVDIDRLAQILDQLLVRSANG
jgi:hypothetical protein